MSKIYLIQHLAGGDYDYTCYESPEAAWEVEKTEPWVKEYPDLDEARCEFLASLSQYTYDEVLEAHHADEEWPSRFGLIRDEDYA